MNEYMEKCMVLAYMIENGYNLGNRSMDDYCNDFTLEEIQQFCNCFLGEDPTKWGPIFLKKFSKSVDIPARVCYNYIIKREEDTTMADWFMNPELHDEDFEEYEKLLRELAEEDEEEE